MEYHYCVWPSCLNREQAELLTREILQEEMTGEPCSIYLDAYPFDQREVCGCREPPRGTTPGDEPPWG